MGLLYKTEKPPVGHIAWEGGLEDTLLSKVIKLWLGRTSAKAVVKRCCYRTGLPNDKGIHVPE